MHRADRGAELNARQPLHRIAAGTAALALSAAWLGPSSAVAAPKPAAPVVDAANGSLWEQEVLLAAYERADRARPEHQVTYKPQFKAASARDAALPPAPPAPPKATPKTASKPPAKKTTTGSGQQGSVAPPSGAAGTVVSFARAQAGKPYVFGQSGPGAYDCSGLVKAAYARVGVNLPHQSEQIAARGRKVPAGQWLPGDVIHTPGHVGIYLGGGQMVAATTPSSGVRIGPVRGGTAYRFL